MEPILWLLGALALVSVGLIVGYLMANHSLPGRHRLLGRRAALLRAETEALTAQRLNAAFMAARRAMWEEASRHRREPGSSAGL